MPPAEQRLFRLLSLHAGPDIGMVAACACDGRTNSATRQSLRRLVAANLLEQPVAFDRFQFHDVIREFASHLTHRIDSPDDRQAAERRLLSHYLATANQAIQTIYPGHMHAPGAEDMEFVEPESFTEARLANDWFDRERGNLTAMIRFGAARGHDDLVWHLVDPVSTCFDRRGYYDDSRSVREIAVMSARTAGHRDAEASALVGLGMVQAILGDHTGAHDNLRAALRIVESTGNRRGQGATLHQLARLQMQCGNPVEAITLYRRCLQVNQDLGDVEGLSWTHCRLGGALRAIDQHEQAVRHLHQGQLHAQQSGDDAALASCQAEIGAVYRDRGDHAAAASYCEQALKTVEGMPVPELVIETQACLSLAELNAEGRNDDVAIHYLDRVARVTGRTHSITDQARANDLRADIHFARGDTDEAENYWRRAAELYGHAGNLVQTAMIG
jgi:tetratricopeptide (TPR) repeat protein